MPRRSCIAPIVVASCVEPSRYDMSSPKRVQFDSILASPPADRIRLGGSYPCVAQKKGASDRQNSLDLYWGQRPISFTASIDTRGRDPSPIVLSDNKHAGKHEANSGRSAVKLPHIVREMLSTACEALTELTSPNLKQGSPRRNATHPLWSCSDRMSTGSTPLETPSSSCYGSSTNSTLNSSPNSPTSESPGTSVFRG